MGSIKDRTGVVSFQAFFKDFNANKTVELSDDELLFLVTNVVKHEIGHMFGIKHCIYYSCCMNGNNLEFII